MRKVDQSGGDFVSVIFLTRMIFLEVDPGFNFDDEGKAPFS
jgi:hypothetical protein